MGFPRSPSIRAIGGCWAVSLVLLALLRYSLPLDGEGWDSAMLLVAFAVAWAMCGHWFDPPESRAEAEASRGLRVTKRVGQAAAARRMQNCVVLQNGDGAENSARLQLRDPHQAGHQLGTG